MNECSFIRGDVNFQFRSLRIYVLQQPHNVHER